MLRESIDVIALGVSLGLLAILTTSAWVLLARLRNQQQLLRGARAIGDGFWSSDNLYDAVVGLDGGNPFRGVVEAGLRAREPHGFNLAAQIGVVERIDYGITREVELWDDRLRAGMDLVDCLAAIAPWVGLAGSVFCIRRALSNPRPWNALELAAAIDLALLMAVLGVAVAVLLKLTHQLVSTRRRHAMSALRDFALNARALLVNGAVR